MNGSRANIVLLLLLSTACIRLTARPPQITYTFSILFKTWFLIRSPVQAALESFFSRHELFFLILDDLFLIILMLLMFLIWLKMMRSRRWGWCPDVILTIPGVSCDCQWAMKENCWGSAVDSRLWLRLCCWCCWCCLDTGSPWRWRPGSKSPCRGWSPWGGGNRGGRAGGGRAVLDSPSVATCKYKSSVCFTYFGKIGQK